MVVVSHVLTEIQFDGSDPSTTTSALEVPESHKITDDRVAGCCSVVLHRYFSHRSEE